MKHGMFVRMQNPEHHRITFTKPIGLTGSNKHAMF